jgi:two-component system sensor histidine kinase YesM
MNMHSLAKLQTFIRIKLSSFRNKLVFSFLIISIIPLILVGILTYTLSYNIARNGILDSISYSNNQLNEALANRFKQMQNASNAMQFYMYTLILQPSPSITSQLDKYIYIKNNISNLQYTFDFFNISVYTNPEFLFSNQGITYFKIEELDKHGVSANELKINSNSLNWRLFQNIKEPFMLNSSLESQNYISAFSTFKKQDSDNLEYVYFIDINESEISKLLSDSSPHPSVQSYIVDKKGKVISHVNRSELGTSIDEHLLTSIMENTGKPFSFNNQQIIVKYNQITDWYVVTEVPTPYIMNNINILVNILLVTLVLVVIVSILSSIFISNSLSTKIRTMSKVMFSLSLQDNNDKLFQLKIPVKSETVYRDELDKLSLVFNEMIRKMDNNFNKLLAMSLHEEHLRYQLLQSKINPHFLYNILESIKTCQTLGRTDDANAMLSRLAKFYRLILKKGDELISIQDELEIAIIYLEMEKLNRQQSFRWTIEKDDQTEYFLIPKFSLQPILENCIRHGLSGGDKAMEIHISIKYLNEDIVITIRDNGIGINRDKLYQIQQSLVQSIKEKTINTDQFYGISNVNMRLSLNGAGLRIDSEENTGTTVTITIQQMIPDEITF